jgi:hypothetical protein
MVMGLGSLHLQQRLSVSSVIGLHAGCLYQRDVGVENYPLLPVVEHIGFVSISDTSSEALRKIGSRPRSRVHGGVFEETLSFKIATIHLALAD